MADGSKLSIDKIRSAIADILETEELDSLTSRMVRNRLEQHFSVGLKDRKKEIDELLMSMIEAREESNKDDQAANGTLDDKKEIEEEDLEDDDKPPPKKAKKDKKTEPKPAKNKSDDDDDDDAEVARKLQESEKGLRKRKQPAKRAPKSTPKKTTGEKSRTGFGKMMVLSPDLAKIVGADQMARSDVVKKMWQIIKERNLTDPKDKRFHICDDELLKVFGKKRVQTFSMMKYLKQHVKDPSLIT